MNDVGFDTEKRNGIDFLNRLNLDDGIYFVLKSVTFWSELLVPFDTGKISGSVIQFVNDSVIPKTNLKSRFRKKKLTQKEYRQCIVLAFNILMDELTHSEKMANITNNLKPIRESYPKEILDVRAESFARNLTNVSIASALENIEGLVTEWSASFYTNDLIELVKNWVYRGGKSEKDLPDDIKSYVHAYIPFLLTLATEA
jgi:hypothetical protein